MSTGRHDEGFDVNVNLLGEAIVGDDEADARLDALCARMRRPDVAYVSVKISALVRQPRRARLRPRGRAHRRTPAHGLRRRRRELTTGVRQPRHGGVPRPPAHGGGVLPGPRRAALRRAPRRDRVAGVPARHPRRAGAARPLGHRPPPPRRRPDQGAAGQGRQPGDGARRRRAGRLGAGHLRHQGRRRRQLQGPSRSRASTPPPSGGLLVGVGSHNLFDVGWALAQRRHRAPRARGRHRDARGHGAAPGPGDARRRRRRRPLHPGRDRGRLRRQHRLPVPPARRELRTGELPSVAAHDHPRVSRVARRTAALRSGRRRAHVGVDGSPPGPGPAERGPAVRSR